MLQYTASDWHQRLSTYQLLDPFKIWECEMALVEPTNYRRGGWSVVGSLSIGSPDTVQETLYVKRQHMHCCRHPYFPWIKIPTLRREYKSMLAFAKSNLPVPEICRYVEWDTRAVLITKGLRDTVDLQTYCQTQPINAFFSKRLANVIAAMHNDHWQHTALYPKHILITRITDDITLIDLENARKRWIKSKASFRDLDSLNRRLEGVSIWQRARFLRYYLYAIGKPEQFSYYVRTLCKKYRKKH